MNKRISLYVFIEYASFLDPLVCKKLQYYAKLYSTDILNPYIRIRTDKLCTSKKITRIPKFKPDPIVTAKIAFFISSSEQLYETLLLLIELSIRYSSKANYSSHINTLTISIPDQVDNLEPYNFNWSLELQLD